MKEEEAQEGGAATSKKVNNTRCIAPSPLVVVVIKIKQELLIYDR